MVETSLILEAASKYHGFFFLLVLIFAFFLPLFLFFLPRVHGLVNLRSQSPCTPHNFTFMQSHCATMMIAVIFHSRPTKWTEFEKRAS
jgi:hypothetical protein